MREDDHWFILPHSAQNAYGSSSSQPTQPTWYEEGYFDHAGNFYTNQPEQSPQQDGNVGIERDGCWYPPGQQVFTPLHDQAGQGASSSNAHQQEHVANNTQYDQPPMVVNGTINPHRSYRGNNTPNRPRDPRYN